MSCFKHMGSSELRWIGSGNCFTNRGNTLESLRPCLVEDGLRRIPEAIHDALIARHQEAAAKGRWLKFVPASGAASRMFALPTSNARRQFCESLEQLAFASIVDEFLQSKEESAAQLCAQRRFDDLVTSVVDPSGLGFGSTPKALDPISSLRPYGENTI